MKVYVRWYGNILEGDLLEGEYLGMKQVRIPLDGHKPIALFTPAHVYETIEAASIYTYPSKAPGDAIADMIKAHREIQQKESVGKFLQDIINSQKIENYKAANWDQERNHLRIDKLEEFYQLWRMVMKPDGFVEAEAPVVTLPSHKPEVDPIEVVPQNETPIQQPQSHKPEKPKPSKKMLRSTGQQDFGDTIQLSIFD